MNKIFQKINKPITVYGYKVLTEIEISVTHPGEDKAVGRFAGWVKKIIISKILGKILNMGVIETKVRIRLVKDPHG